MVSNQGGFMEPGSPNLPVDKGSFEAVNAAILTHQKLEKFPLRADEDITDALEALRSLTDPGGNHPIPYFLKNQIEDLRELLNSKGEENPALKKTILGEVAKRISKLEALSEDDDERRNFLRQNDIDETDTLFDPRQEINYPIGNSEYTTEEKKTVEDLYRIFEQDNPPQPQTPPLQAQQAENATIKYPATPQLRSEMKALNDMIVSKDPAIGSKEFFLRVAQVRDEITQNPQPGLIAFLKEYEALRDYMMRPQKFG